MEQITPPPTGDLGEALYSLCADPDHPGFEDRGGDPHGHEKFKSIALDQIPSWCEAGLTAIGVSDLIDDYGDEDQEPAKIRR